MRKLTRTQLGPVKLGPLKSGELRDLTLDELGELLEAAQLLAGRRRPIAIAGVHVRAVRGATQLEVDERDHMLERVAEMVTDVMTANGLEVDDFISVIFTATERPGLGVPGVRRPPARLRRRPADLRARARDRRARCRGWCG